MRRGKGGRRREVGMDGWASLGVTSIYLEGIDSAEIIDAVHANERP